MIIRQASIFADGEATFGGDDWNAYLIIREEKELVVMGDYFPTFRVPVASASSALDFLREWQAPEKVAQAGPEQIDLWEGLRSS